MLSDVLAKELHEVNILDVEKEGKLIDKKETNYIEKYNDADGEGGRWRETCVWLYRGKQYIGVYDCYDFPFRKKTCIRFRELKEEDLKDR